MSEEYGEDQFDGFVTSNSKNKYEYFNDIEVEKSEKLTDIPEILPQQINTKFNNNLTGMGLTEIYNTNINGVGQLPQLQNNIIMHNENQLNTNEQQEEQEEFDDYVEVQTDQKIQSNEQMIENQQNTDIITIPIILEQNKPLDTPIIEQSINKLVSVFDAFEEASDPTPSPILQLIPTAAIQNQKDNTQQISSANILSLYEQETKAVSPKDNNFNNAQEITENNGLNKKIDQQINLLEIDNLQYINSHQDQNIQIQEKQQIINQTQDGQSNQQNILTNFTEIDINAQQQQDNLAVQKQESEDEFDEFVEGEQIQQSEQICEQDLSEIHKQDNNEDKQQQKQFILEKQMENNQLFIKPSELNQSYKQQQEFIQSMPPIKEIPIERRNWRGQIEDIVGLDADCMEEFIQELQDLKLTVYLNKVEEYAQLSKDIQILRKKKQVHVDNEEYEEATVIRDTLRAKEPIAMVLKKKILEIAQLMDLLDGQQIDYHIKNYLYETNNETIQNATIKSLQPKVEENTEFVNKLKKELKKSESVLQIIKLQGQLEKIRYEKKYQIFILGLRKIIGMCSRFPELNEQVQAVNDRLNDLKLEREICQVDEEFILENTLVPYLKQENHQIKYCNYCFLAKENLKLYQEKWYDVCCLNFFYNIN